MPMLATAVEIDTSARSRMPAPLANLFDVDIDFGQLRAVNGVNLSIRRGEFISFLGPSGCGKSTLLKAIAGLIPLSQGGIEFPNGRPRLGIMFQKPLLLPWRTALANVLLPMEIECSGSTPSSAVMERARHLLELVRLADFAKAYPGQLSGGMQQRIALARALMPDPEVLLLDEPFGALDELTREVLNEELIDIWNSRATRLGTVVMVTHSIPEAVAMSDRIVVLTPRPAHVMEIVTVPFPHPRQREDREVALLIKKVRHLVRNVP
jgi:ABC-type nitrate/sulfonate/bicarbonate transport system ATPase subunit